MAVNVHESAVLAPLPSPPRSRSAPATLAWTTADAAHLGPSRITISRLFDRTPKAPYHRLESHTKAPSEAVAKSPGPQKKKRCTTLDAGPNPFRIADDCSDLSEDEEEDFVQVPVQEMRSSSAPPEDTIPPESRPAPRMSDDTAILHAFLNRAAASKRSMPASKRESLENRRDSDVVRQALASTDKPDVLTEMDPNSPPSPAKPSSPDAHADTEAEPEKPQPAVEAPPPAPAQSKAPRRTLRTRTRVATPSKPAKIAIRSAADHVALKRTEAQELALLTRTNTRKNKAKSIMPAARLQKLAQEDAPIDTATEVPTADDATTDEAPLRKAVQWDATLAYYQELQPDPPSSPPAANPKARRTRNSLSAAEPLAPTPASVDTEPAAAQQPLLPTTTSTPPPEQTPRATQPLATKRKSRIATPARASKLTAPKDHTLPKPTTLPPPPQPQQQQSEARLINTTPKKLPIPFIGAKSSSFSNLEFPPPQSSSLLPSTATAQTSSLLPSLASSPAKKRARSGIAKVRPVHHADAEMPGLTSPAKRKRAGVRFS